MCKGWIVRLTNPKLTVWAQSTLIATLFIQFFLGASTNTKLFDLSSTTIHEGCFTFWDVLVAFHLPAATAIDVLGSSTRVLSQIAHYWSLFPISCFADVPNPMRTISLIPAEEAAVGIEFRVILSTHILPSDFRPTHLHEGCLAVYVQICITASLRFFVSSTSGCTDGLIALLIPPQPAMPETMAALLTNPEMAKAVQFALVAASRIKLSVILSTNSLV
mmetsp:Transcript_18931/g.34053  ORF Transcript_18931/g.34053 Transcript_18931/m.34053 type:complete len:219 (-) Transcript_18931:956-1612(-)